MAGLIFIAEPGAEVALAAGVAKTVLQVAAPTNQRLKTKGVGVFFDGVSVTGEPVVIELLRQTTAGTMTSLTPKKRDTYTEVVQSTASHTATVEPTAGDVIDTWEVHPQQGLEIFYPLGDEPKVGGGGRVGLRINAPANVNCRPKLIMEE